MSALYMQSNWRRRYKICGWWMVLDRPVSRNEVICGSPVRINTWAVPFAGSGSLLSFFLSFLFFYFALSSQANWIKNFLLSPRMPEACQDHVSAIENIRFKDVTYCTHIYFIVRASACYLCHWIHWMFNEVRKFFGRRKKSNVKRRRKNGRR